MLSEAGKRRKHLFAQRLRDSRIQADLSQQKLAYLFAGKASPQVVSSWERGRAMPHACEIPELAALLGVRPGWLVGWED